MHLGLLPPFSLETVGDPGYLAAFARGTDPARLAEFTALGVDRIVCTAHESGAADVDTVVDFVGRMRDVLDEDSG